LLLSGCSSNGSTADTAAPTPTATVTTSSVVPVTPTVTITATVGVTVTTKKTVAITVTEMSQVSTPTQVNVTTSSPNEADESEEFDRQWAMTNARYIIEDIGVVDERLGDGIMVSSALDILSDSDAGLAEAGTPPGVLTR
jgi:hypothetical protein